MGSQAKKILRAKTFNTKEKLTFQLFAAVHELRSMLTSLNKRHEVFDCYIARLERLLIEKNVVTQDEIDKIAAQAIEDASPEKAKALEPTVIDGTPSLDDQMADPAPDVTYE